MGFLGELADIHKDRPAPFLVDNHRAVTFADVLDARPADLSSIRQGDVVALIGDFTPEAISTLIRLIDLGVIVVPLTTDTRASHDYMFDAAGVDFVIEDGTARRLRSSRLSHELLDRLRSEHHPGLILFSSGTTGRPKAILHDTTRFFARYRTPRAPLKTLSFLLFDHIGGLNTLFHTLYNRGQVVVPSSRLPEGVLGDMVRHDIALLPTTPTFLRMLLLSGLLEDQPLPSLKIITYGTEPMDPGTLKALHAALPDVDLRQTYGMSELGILRVRSRAPDSLFMKIGGEGVELDVRNGVLWIKSENRMLGYLNAPSPFVDGWYDTGDLVEVDGDYLRIVGRSKLVINVGGVKILPEEIERIAMNHPRVALARAEGKPNPITGQHIVVTCEPRAGDTVSVDELRKHFAAGLPESLRPHRIRVDKVDVNYRFKRS